MAWPWTARHRDYSAGMSVTSANLNSIQDMSFLMMGAHTVQLLHGTPSFTAGAPDWEYQSGGYWECIADGKLFVFIERRVGATMDDSAIGCEVSYRSVASAAPPTFTLSINTTNDGSGPSSSVLQAITPTVVTATWDNWDLGSATESELLVNQYWELEIDGFDGDLYSGTNVTYSKLIGF